MANVPYLETCNFYNVPKRTDMPGQEVQTQSRLLLEEPSLLRFHTVYYPICNFGGHFSVATHFSSSVKVFTAK